MAPPTKAQAQSFSLTASLFFALTAVLVAVPSASAYDTQFVPLCVPEVACVRAHAGSGGGGVDACINEEGGAGIDWDFSGRIVVWYPDPTSSTGYSHSGSAC